MDGTRQNADRDGDVDRRRDDSDSARAQVDYPTRVQRFQSNGLDGKYKRGGRALTVLGVLALVGAIWLQDARSVLIALGGTGLFGAVLLLYLTPERITTQSTNESIYTAIEMTGKELIDEFKLRDDRIYIPIEGDTDVQPSVRLFIPAHGDFAIPGPHEAMELLIENPDGGIEGLSLPPTALELYREFSASAHPSIADEPSQMADQVVDALVNQFELVEEATSTVEPERVTIAVTGSLYGPVDRLDHPVTSFSAVSLATILDVPVDVDVTPGDGRADYLVICTWDEQHVAD